MIFARPLDDFNQFLMYSTPGNRWLKRASLHECNYECYGEDSYKQLFYIYWFAPSCLFILVNIHSALAIVLGKKLLSIAFFHEMCSASDFQTVLNNINKSIYLQMLTQSVWPIASFRLKKYSVLKIA